MDVSEKLIELIEMEALKMTELKPCPSCGARMDEKEDKHEDYT